MKAIVNQDECISCGMCIDICSDVFSYNLDNKSVAIDGDILEENIPLVAEARDACPVNAISIVEDDNNLGLSEEFNDTEDSSPDYYADKIDDLDTLEDDYNSFLEEDSEDNLEEY